MNKEGPPVETYASYKLMPLIQKIVVDDGNHWRNSVSEKTARNQGIIRSVWGDVDFQNYTSPSIAAFCLRWAGYDKLDYKAAPDSFESQMNMLVGTGSHNMMARKLSAFGLVEQKMLTEDPGLTGRYDFLMRNHLTGEWQVADFKFSQSWGFKQIKREKLEPELKDTKGIFAPKDEARMQMLLYMWTLRKQGINVTCGNIIYFNRDKPGKFKECLVLWDAKAEYDVENFVEKIKEANKQIEEGKLPEATVVDPGICKNICPYLPHCEHGRKFVDKGTRKKKIRRPTWVYREAEKKKREDREKMVILGLVQPELPGLESDNDSPPKREKEKKKKEEEKEKIIYVDGDHELDQICPRGCDRHMIRSVRLISDLQGGKKRISINDHCPSHGGTNEVKKTVSGDQYVTEGVQQTS